MMKIKIRIFIIIILWKIAIKERFFKLMKISRLGKEKTANKGLDKTVEQIYRNKIAEPT